MKKQFKKKLLLNKTTVSNLSPGEMSDAFGGSIIVGSICKCESDSVIAQLCCGNTTNPELVAAPEPREYDYL